MRGVTPHFFGRQTEVPSPDPGRWSEWSRGVPRGSRGVRPPEGARGEPLAEASRGDDSPGARRESLLEGGGTSVCAARLPEGNPFWAQGKGPKLKSAVALFKLLYLIN